MLPVPDPHSGNGFKTTPPGFVRGLRLPGDQDEDKSLSELSAALEESTISTERQDDNEVYGILINVFHLLSDLRILHLVYWTL